MKFAAGGGNLRLGRGRHFGSPSSQTCDCKPQCFRFSAMPLTQSKPRKVAAKKPAARKSTGKATKNGYNPVAPERVSEILKRLDQRYPGVTCALHHKSPWELLV